MRHSEFLKCTRNVECEFLPECARSVSSKAGILDFCDSGYPESRQSVPQPFDFARCCALEFSTFRLALFFACNASLVDSKRLCEKRPLFFAICESVLLEKAFELAFRVESESAEKALREWQRYEKALI